MTASFSRPHYAHPPIAEAIIEIRPLTPAAVDLKQLDQVAEQLASEFPAQLPIYQFRWEVQADTPGAPPAMANNQELMGRRLTSKGLDRVLQLQRPSFIYSHLPPYTDWANFAEEAKRYWTAFQQTTQLEQVSRVAVRVINHIPVPRGEVNMQDYLAVYAVVPETLPPVANAAYLQLQFSAPEIQPDARVIVNVASGQANQNGSILLLDIDLFVERVMSTGKEMWEIIETLGLHKDKIFEACITEKVREAIR